MSSSRSTRSSCQALPRKLNPLRLAHIAVAVAEQYKDPTDAGMQAAPLAVHRGLSALPCLSSCTVISACALHKQLHEDLGDVLMLLSERLG